MAKTKKVKKTEAEEQAASQAMATYLEEQGVRQKVCEPYERRRRYAGIEDRLNLLEDQADEVLFRVHMLEKRLANGQ